MAKKTVHGTSNAGYEIIAQRFSGSNPDNRFLHVVMGEQEGGEFVTWIYNDQTGGFGSGHYFEGCDAFEAAIRDFTLR